MKKVLSVIAVLTVAASCIFAQAVQEQKPQQKTLTVYAYDTFCGDWGAAGSVIPAFEEATGIKVNLVASGAAIEVINKVRLEGKNTECDVILGITDDIADKAYDLLESYDSPYIQTIDERYRFDAQNRLIPYDYGAFAFVFLVFGTTKEYISVGNGFCCTKIHFGAAIAAEHLACINTAPAC